MLRPGVTQSFTITARALSRRGMPCHAHERHADVNLIRQYWQNAWAQHAAPLHVDAEAIVRHLHTRWQLGLGVVVVKVVGEMHQKRALRMQSL